LANYSYLSDGTKLSATDGSGKGLVYRGTFVYRKSSDDSSLTLESAAFSGGRMTPDGVLLHVTDYLGSVRAVVDGQTGELYKASDYSAFGSESEVETMQTAITPLGITLRDGYTGKENQNLDFSTNYTDFGARQYNPALRRWMTPDPLSEKYYGISPYAFCNNNPVRYVDVDGMDWWDKVAGYGIGLITDLVPGTGSLRDKYTPNDPSDYNMALRDVDLTMLAVGESMTKAGGAMMAGGATLAVTGVSVTVTTAGTAVIVGGPATVIGADIAVTGAATAGTGIMMMSNSSANQSQGYERGKASAASSSGKSINQLQHDVKKGKAPKGLKRFDRKHTEGGQEHVHFEDGSALNKDGSWKEGEYNLNKSQVKYLKDNGWDI
jgi:RHS repeat-associated protein